AICRTKFPARHIEATILRIEVMFTFLAWCELQQKDKYFQRKKSLIDQRKGYLRRGNLTEGLYIGLDYEKVYFV
ncbi:hypothetical protein, partial [Acetobacter pasteurianus]|uniref:hypothetical protein n=1 Tax=Acetobacter pasteurianus TaxID=438 RepID=UPI001BDFF192